MDETDRSDFEEDIERTQSAPPPTKPEGEKGARPSAAGIAGEGETQGQESLNPEPQTLNPDVEKTQAVPSASAGDPSVEASAPLSQEEQDRRLAADLARRGVPPEEVQRLLALGRGETPAPAAPQKAAPALATPPPVPPSEAYVPKPTITLPPFREATAQQRIEADRLLTTANVARRRGNFKEAEKSCREAIERVPQDAAALELYGDILQSVGRVDDALFAYHRATEADPTRAFAEKKYAELMLLQNREIELLREEYIPRNPIVAVLFSALFPGAGQVYNGEPLKGILIALVVAACVLALGWTNYGFPGAHDRITPSLVVLMAVASLVYIYAVVEASISARRGKRPKSGWEV